VIEFLVILLALMGVVALIAAPLRRPAVAGAGPDRSAALLAAREAKLREIREAELDHRTGKLSDADYAALDAALRAEAVEILHQLDNIA
jgi:hypothetical protein